MLALSLIVVMTMVVLSGTFLQVSSTITRRQGQAADQKRSFYLAEAGLAEAFSGLRVGRTGVVGTAAAPARFGDGLFWVEREDLGEGLIALQSTGQCGTAETILDLVVQDGSASVAALGVFSGGDLEVPSGSVFDAYDSGEGAYVPPGSGGGGTGGGETGGSGTIEIIGGLTGGGETTSGGTYPMEEVDYERKEGSLTLYEDIGNEGVARVSTNGTVVIRETDGGQTRILGDLRPGPGGSVEVEGEPEITGSTAPLTVGVILPDVPTPDLGTQQPGYTHSLAAPMVFPAVVGSYEYLIVAPNSQVTVTGPTTLVLEDLVLLSGSELVLDTTAGPIALYVSDQLNLADGSFVTFTRPDPLAFTLSVSGTTPATLAATSAFYGAVYAPHTSVEVAPAFEIFGALVANLLTFTGPVSMHFDAALGASAENAALPSRFSWRILELAGAAIPSGDPFAAAGVTQAGSPQPRSAHKDQQLTIDYYDRTGTRQVYDGMESSFDWSEVSQALAVERDGDVVGKVFGLAGIGGTGDGGGVVTVDLR